MATVAKNQIGVTVVKYTISGNRLSTTLNYMWNNAVTTAHIAAQNTNFATNLLGHWMSCVSQDVHFQQLYSYALQPGLAIPAVHEFVDTNGSIAYDSVPSNTAAIFRIAQTMVSARHNGMFFVSGLPVTDLEDGLITEASITDHWDTLRGALTDTVTGPGGASALLGVVQRYNAGAPITAVGHTWAQVSIQKSPGTQRRRTTELREVHQ